MTLFSINAKIYPPCNFITCAFCIAYAVCAKIKSHENIKLKFCPTNISSYTVTHPCTCTVANNNLVCFFYVRIPTDFGDVRSDLKTQVFF